MIIFYLFAFLIVFAGAGYWFLLRKGPLRVTVLPLSEEKTGRPAVQNPKRTPEFIEELRRREQRHEGGTRRRHKKKRIQPRRGSSKRERGRGRSAPQKHTAETLRSAEGRREKTKEGNHCIVGGALVAEK